MLNSIANGSRKNKDIKNFPELNEYTAFPNLWYTKKSNVRKKIHITIVYIKNFEKNLTSDSSAHLKALEQKKTNVYRRNR